MISNIKEYIEKAEQIKRKIDQIIDFLSDKSLSDTIRMYGYEEFKDFILDIAKNNFLNSYEVKRLFLEHKLISNVFILYLEMVSG